MDLQDKTRFYAFLASFLEPAFDSHRYDETTVQRGDVTVPLVKENVPEVKWAVSPTLPSAPKCQPPFYHFHGKCVCSE